MRKIKIYYLIIVIVLFHYTRITEGIQISINGRNVYNSIYKYIDGEIIDATCQLPSTDGIPRFTFQVNGKVHVEATKMDQNHKIHMKLRLLATNKMISIFCEFENESKHIELKYSLASNQVRSGWRINDMFFDLNTDAASMNYEYKFDINEDLEISLLPYSRHVTRCQFIYSKDGDTLTSIANIEIQPINSLKITKTTKSFENSIIYCTTTIAHHSGQKILSTEIRFRLAKFSPFLHNLNTGSLLAVSENNIQLHEADNIYAYNVVIHEGRCKILVCFLSNDSVPRPVKWVNYSEYSDGYIMVLNMERSEKWTSIFSNVFFPDAKTSNYPGCLERRDSKSYDLAWDYIEGTDNLSPYAQKILGNSTATIHKVDENYSRKSNDGSVEITYNDTDPPVVQQVKLRYDNLVLTSSLLEIDPYIKGLNDRKIFLILAPQPDLNIILYEYEGETLQLGCFSRSSYNEGTLEYKGNLLSRYNVTVPLDSDSINCTVQCSGKKKVTLLKLLNRDLKKYQAQEENGKSLLSLFSEHSLAIISSICVAVVIFVTIITLTVCRRCKRRKRRKLTDESREHKKQERKNETSCKTSPDLRSPPSRVHKESAVCFKKRGRKRSVHNQGHKKLQEPNEVVDETITESGNTRSPPPSDRNELPDTSDGNEYEYVYGSRIRSGLTELQLPSISWQNRSQWHSRSTLISDAPEVSQGHSPQKTQGRWKAEVNKRQDRELQTSASRLHQQQTHTNDSRTHKVSGQRKPGKPREIEKRNQWGNMVCEAKTHFPQYSNLSDYAN